MTQLCNELVTSLPLLRHPPAVHRPPPRRPRALPIVSLTLKPLEEITLAALHQPSQPARGSFRSDSEPASCLHCCEDNSVSPRPERRCYPRGGDDPFWISSCETCIYPLAFETMANIVECYREKARRVFLRVPLLAKVSRGFELCLGEYIRVIKTLESASDCFCRQSQRGINEINM